MVSGKGPPASIAPMKPERPFARFRSVLCAFRKAFAPAVFISAVGCATNEVGIPTPLPDREERMGRAYVFYLDGAGGGTTKKNWAGGVRDGLLEAGYTGAGEMVSWESGRGLVADQVASVEFKRQGAAKLAARIEEFKETRPGVPVHLIGFSAGCGEVIYGLEALPESKKVDNVVLLGASFSRDYDMTEALKRVGGNVTFFTSTHDQMIGLMTRIGGTTDRKRNDPSAGITGPVLPAGATAETRRLYEEKIMLIPHTEDMELVGDRGHHFDNVKKEFIRDYVAPIVMRE